MKKKTIGIIATAAFAIAAVGAPVAAAPSEKGAEAACFGQIHKAVNQGALLSDPYNLPLANVGEAVQFLGGQGKNAFARGEC